MIVRGKESVIKFGTYVYGPVVKCTTEDITTKDISSVFLDEDMLFIPTQTDINDLLESMSKQGVVDEIIASGK